MCCPTSPSLPKFENLVRENRTKCACSFFPISSDKIFCLSAKRHPSEPRTWKLMRVATALVGIKMLNTLRRVRTAVWLKTWNAFGCSLLSFFLCSHRVASSILAEPSTLIGRQNPYVRVSPSYVYLRALSNARPMFLLQTVCLFSLQDTEDIM